MPKTTFDYLQEILIELRQQYDQHPEGNKIRYEVYLGDDDVEEFDDESVSYGLRVDALEQLKEEGVVEDYVIDERFEDIPLGEYAATRVTYKVAKCLLDKKKFLAHTGGLNPSSPNRKTENEPEHDEDIVVVALKEGELKINRLTGIVHINEIPTQFNPTSKQFEVILKLADSKNYQATYEDLLGANPTKDSIRNLTFDIRNIKEALEILPAHKAKHQDFIQNIKNHGYKLIT